jgi:hypothetical protein
MAPMTKKGGSMQQALQATSRGRGACQISLEGESGLELVLTATIKTTDLKKNSDHKHHSHLKHF